MNKINTINGVLMASQDELNEHVENGTAHVTEEERTVWNTQASVNAKGIVIATQGDLDEHTANKAIHLTEEERTAWNAKADTLDLVSKVDVETFNAHKGDDAVHITEKDRNSWNGKQDKLTDDEGNMTLAGALTTGAVINANGGINIPGAVAPMLTGAVTNNELLDYVVDRVVRTAPYITVISGLDLADCYDAAQSSGAITRRVYNGGVRLASSGGIYEERKAVFSANNLLFAPTQSGPFYYRPHVTVISGDCLLCMSYLTSPGAVVSLKIRASNDDAQYYGVRLRNDEKKAYYELFYKHKSDDAETVAVREAVPSVLNLYTGSFPPQNKLNSLVIYVPGSFGEASHTLISFGDWKMDVPFCLFSNAQLELYAKNGSVNINYYGVALGVTISTIHQIALGYESQLVPTLNNAAYQS